MAFIKQEQGRHGNHDQISTMGEFGDQHDEKHHCGEYRTPR
jgi:hypothetical protein